MYFVIPRSKPKDKAKSILSEVVEEMDRADDIISHIDKTVTQTDKTVVEVEEDFDEDLMKEEQDLMEEFDRGQYNGVIGVSCNATAEVA